MAELTIQKARGKEMTTMIVYLLVGYVHWGSGGTAAPAYPAFPDKAACETIQRAIQDVATNSKLRCVETRIVRM